MLPSVGAFETNGGHAFLCYTREDSSRVDELESLLQSTGIPVWRDTADLLPGQDWRMQIRRAITAGSLAFLACFSRAGLARRVSFQNEELTLAVEQARLRQAGDSWLIPVRFDECEIPDISLGGGRTLPDLQCADLFGDRREAATDRLVAAVRQILGTDAAVNSTHSAPTHAPPAEPVPAGHLDGRRRSANLRDRWVVTLLEFVDIDNPEFRLQVLRLMGDELGLGHPFMASYRGMARDHVIEIVGRCWAYGNRRAALAALADALTCLRPDERPVGQLDGLLQEL
jgi:TIR domain/Effector-associated domain 2